MSLCSEVINDSTDATSAFGMVRRARFEDKAKQAVCLLNHHPSARLPLPACLSISIIPARGCPSFGLPFQNPGCLVAIPGKGYAPYLIVPEGYYALVTTNGAEIQTGDSPVWPAGFIFAGPFTR